MRRQNCRIMSLSRGTEVSLSRYKMRKISLAVKSQTGWNQRNHESQQRLSGYCYRDLPKSLGPIPPANQKRVEPCTNHPLNGLIFASRRLQPLYNSTPRYLPIRRKSHIISPLTSVPYKKHKICEHFQCTSPAGEWLQAIPVGWYVAGMMPKKNCGNRDFSIWLWALHRCPMLSPCIIRMHRHKIRMTR